jgi:PRTRC genetic system protein A
MFVRHFFAQGDLPPIGNSLYEYVVGANGVFVRAKRPGLEALIWVAATAQPIRGLPEIEPFVRLDPLVPVNRLAKMFQLADEANGKEILFHLTYWDQWLVNVPRQYQASVSVRPADPFAGGVNTMIEVHSHHNMGAFFSQADNNDERGGFRIYAVIGGLSTRPTILTRVGIYGHFMEIPSDWVFQLPPGVTDALYQETELEYVDITD